MTTPPRLTDRAALALRRARAARDPADFLHRAAAAEVSDRLAEVNRRFTRPAIVGPMAALWRELLVADGVIGGAALAEDAEVLDLVPEAHDLLIHALALHWADDPVGQLVQMRHALAPDGLMIAAQFGSRSLQELRASLSEAELALRGGLSPRIAPMGEIRDLGGLLQRAGFALPVADALVLPVTYPDALALMRDLRAMGESNALAARDRRPPPRALFARAAALYARNFPAPDDPGRILATAEIVLLTGWKPAPGQPQPLRPGSARARLADALGTAEIPAGETVAGTGDRDNDGN
ncbi:SAM-dependent methyltransferase [Rhodobacteraceae bacterium 2CG4]|uniref:SAM-dependent methyltransferase n=1 Tax=Halovulum marinum TaxID=2662447 RepID=A0A6L5YZY4_9RHOB|nr:SAM-dependent methyltransferase [Halovulum marinum]MSU89415.1 SAM-dependent methyltransferase [Halovulum marinum]